MFQFWVCFAGVIFLLTMPGIFLPLCIPGKCQVDSDIRAFWWFTSLGARYCIPVSLKLCSRRQLSYWETVWSYWVLIFLGGTTAAFNLGFIVPHCWGETILSPLSKALGIMRFPRLASGNRYCFLLCVSSWCLYLLSSLTVLPDLGLGLRYCLPEWTSPTQLIGSSTLCSSSKCSLCNALLLVLCPANTYPLVLQVSHLHLHSSVHWAPPGFPSPHCQTPDSWGMRRASHVCFLSQGSLVLMACVHHVKNLFHIFCFSFFMLFFSRQQCKSGLCCSISARSRSSRDSILTCSLKACFPRIFNDKGW